MMKLEFNPQVHEKLREQNIDFGFDENEALLLLLSIYYNLPVLCISEIIVKKVNLTKIVERDYEKAKKDSNYQPKWNIPLFVEDVQIDENWEWVDKEYRLMFGEIRLDAKGDKNGCITKMKKFFSANPAIRKEDVIMAAKLYLTPFRQNSSNVKYMQRADYFISKVVEGSKLSRLEQYLEQVKTINKTNSGNNSRMTVIS